MVDPDVDDPRDVARCRADRVGDLLGSEVDTRRPRGGLGDRPASGDELTYHELEFESLAAAKRYAGGESVSVRHRDFIRTVGEDAKSEESKPKRKRA